MADIEEKTEEQVNESEDKTTETADVEKTGDSQEVDHPISDAEAAKLALADEQKPPVAAVAEQRTKKQEALAETEVLKTQMADKIATLTGQVTALTQMMGTRKPAADSKPAELSPIDEYIKENGSEAPIDGKLILADRKWQADQIAATDQADQAAAAKSQEEHITAAQAEFSAEKAGEGMDFDTVLQAGMSFLSADDKVAIASATPAARPAEAYKRTLAALQDSKLVNSLVRAKLTSIAAGDPKITDEDGQHTGEKDEADETLTQQQILDSEDEPEIDAVTARAMGRIK